MTTQKLFKEDVMETFDLFYEEGKYVEVRLLGSKYGIVSGYFNDRNRFADEIAKFNGNVKGVYVTINPVTPTFDTQENKLHQYVKKTTADKDITSRKWMLVDIDPKRKAGVSSTEEELQEAIEVATRVKNFTDENNFSAPVEATSGNGIHLLYAIDLPNDTESNKLVQSVLKVLDEKFSTDTAEVDVTTYNASRISKVYGTLACKGENTHERPHRLATIDFVPDEILFTPSEQLEEVAKMLKVPKVNNVKPTSNGNTKTFDVAKFLTDNDLKVNHIKEDEEGKTYVLEKCPWNEDHIDKAAYVLQLKNGAIAAGCHHASCEGNDWYSLRQMFESKSKKEDSKSLEAFEVLNEITQGLPLYTDEMGVPYTTIQKQGAQMCVDMGEDEFSKYLTYRYWMKVGKSVPSESLKRMIDVLKARASFEGEKREKYLRVAFKNGNLYYKLANQKNEVLKISKDSVTIKNTDEVFFRSTPNEAAQVTPDLENGDIHKLFNHVRMNEENKLLYAVYVCTALLPNISHAILVLQGSKGAAKSTTMAFTRQLIDPAKQPKLQLVKKERDFTTTLYSNYVASYDNIRSFSKEMSDTFCMTSTGGAIPLRKLYTTNDEVLLDIRRVVMLNGINFSVTEPDLVDRSLLIQLDRIPEEQRQTEEHINAAFEQDKPAIFGGIIKVLQKAMNIYPTIELNKLPRLADFAKWGYAIAEAIGKGNGDKFLKAYEKNRQVFNDEVIQMHPVSAVIALFMKSQQTWKGAIAKLLNELDVIANDHRIDITDKRYPKSASLLSRRLKEVHSNLKDIGITFEIKNVGQHKEITLVNKCFDETETDSGKVKKKPKSLSKLNLGH